MNRKTQLTLGRQDEESFVPSTIPSTQDDVKQLEEHFQLMLYKEFALECGLCAKRRRIYDDLFNELIRITQVHCSERGLLLERIRNEYGQWMNTYEELYSSSMAYSMRQYLYRMEEKKNLESAVSILESDCQQLRDELEKESAKSQELIEQGTQRIRRDDPEQRTIRQNIRFLKSSNKKMRREIESTLNQILSSSIFLGEPINYEKKTT